MKKLFRKIEEIITWFMSKRVLEAINNGATREEVEEIVKEEMR
jgi:hypothetical protein